MNLTNIIQKKKNRLSYFIQKNKQKLQQLSTYRIFSFLAFLSSTILSYLYRDYIFLFFLPSAFFILFLVLVYFYGKLNKFIQRLQAFKLLLDRQILRAQRKISELDREGASVENLHFYKDLDILGKNSLYNFLDTTVTKSGNDLFLKAILQTEPFSLEEIHLRQKAIGELCQNKYFSQKLLRLLNEMSPSSGYTKIASLKISFSLEEYFQKHFIQKFFISIIFVNYLLVIFFFILEKAHLISAIFSLQFVFSYWNFREKSKLKKHILNFVEKSETQEKIILFLSQKKFNSSLLQTYFRFDSKQVFNLFQQVKQISSKVKVWNSPILNLLFNILFLWDFFVFKKFAQFEFNFKSSVKQMISGIEILDSLLPFFVLYYHNQESEFPNISPNVQKIQAEWIAHPFLEPGTRVGNPLEAISIGTGILITGSNMSGKTTYLRTIGINSLLALCGAPTLSKGFSLPPLKILSSIRNEDSLQDGISFFYAEVRKIKYILESIESSKIPCLILIDEVFKGTNTRERIIATKKILEELQKYPTFVVVTTHDLDLAKVLKKTSYKLKHFEEQIQDGKMSFDYKIRDGMVTSSNALKLLSLEYPRIQFLDP